MTTLPVTNELGYFSIRLESIGGLGANLAGKMLAEAGVLGSGLNGVNFSSYGSEKKGSPVKSFVLFGDSQTEIRSHSPIEEPDVIGVFHEALFKTTPVLSGLRTGGTVLINSSKSIEQLSQFTDLPNGKIAIINALQIAIKEKTRVNTAMLGALFRICDFLNPEDMRQTIRKTFERKNPHLVDANIKTFDRGYQEVTIHTVEDTETEKTNSFIQEQPELGYLTQEIGGIISGQGNSLLKDLASSRQGFVPALEKESCINCAACDYVCPDFCFVWEERISKRGKKRMLLKGIDYQYCKGCLKCVEACPSNALRKVKESDQAIRESQAQIAFPLIKGGE
ncbi:pyruvate ferredoxin oxidoreductase gamma subunit [Natronobacillus azotifigens]|uniref:2-oxoacid:acceptor oxidoreductase family protein n=1 Tax=Natronobacillus azotifigens TaxID=472978 RepID=A0A9J6REG5_9BACI|nr:2-oxoacid:acceptor oxidoreductase family protein [Natronobacillus azotifigens]MCZ0703748.1 2-oxoacid:acceptor oxidoreductase family protein [Natronobacillus azotifigens]